MTRFTISLAGIPIGVSVLHQETAEKYQGYLAEDIPIFSVGVTQRHIAHERALVRRLAAQDAQTFGHLQAEAALDDQSAYHQIAERLPEFGAMLIHGSAVAVDGQAYLFLAPSGTGKSTHVRLWREYFGPRAVMVNDDKPVLSFREDGVWISGTPWQGKENLGNPISVPLRAACVLRRAAVNQVRPLSVLEAYPGLVQQCYAFEEAAHMAQALQLLERLAESVPMFRLGCNMEPEAARVAYEGIEETLRNRREGEA